MGCIEVLLASATQVTSAISNLLISMCMPLEFSSTEGPEPISSACVSFSLASKFLTGPTLLCQTLLPFKST